MLAASILALRMLGPAAEPAATEPAATEPAATEPAEPPAPVLPEAAAQPGPSEPATQGPVAAPAPEPSQPPEPSAEPESEPGYQLRDPRDLPYAPTPARKSALHRGNEALIRSFRKPVFSAAAAFRFGILAGGGLDVMQPFGYGFGAQLRAHFAPLFRARFGLELHAGHTRWSERESFESFEGATVERSHLLATTDVSLGPSFEIPIGPVFLQLGGTAGMVVSSLNRPVSLDAFEDERVSAINFALRGGLSLGVPIYSGHGLSLSGAFTHVFSAREVAVELAEPEGDQTRPFGASIEVGAAYTIWF